MNTFKAALRSEHRCHEQRREIHTINISNKTVEFAGILFYTSTDILVVLLLVKYVPQYMERYDQQELSWERGADKVSSKIARQTLREYPCISINGLIACSNLRNPVLFVKPRYQHTYSPHCCQHFSYDPIWENLFKHQDISSLVTISFFLVTRMFDQPVIL